MLFTDKDCYPGRDKHIASSQFPFLEFPFLETQPGRHKQMVSTELSFLEKVQVTDAELRKQEMQTASHFNYYKQTVFVCL